MDIDVLANIAGVLGFIISVFIFTLTRLERCKKCVVEIVIEHDYHFYKYQDEAIKIRITNIGGQPIIVNLDSFYFSALNKSTTLNQNQIDWFCRDKIPSPLNPGSSCEIAVVTDILLDLLGFKSLDKYRNNEDADKTKVSIEAGFKDVNNKAYKSIGSTYFYYVNALERST